MELKYSSTIQSFYDLMPWAYFLNRNDMEEKTIQVQYQGATYEVHVQVTYTGINSDITAQVGESTLYLKVDPDTGVNTQVTGEPLDKKLVLEIEWSVLKSLEQ